MIVFGEEAASKGACNRVPQVSAANAAKLVSAFRAKLLLRGARSLIGIATIFKNSDEDGSGSLNFPEFHKAVKDSKMQISVDDVRSLFIAFDRDRTGTIEYDEFLNTVRGPMPENRLQLVR
jgi:calcyphosin